MKRSRYTGEQIIGILREQEPSCSLIKRLDVPADTGEHHGAFERGHDLERVRHSIGAADPL